MKYVLIILSLIATSLYADELKYKDMPTRIGTDIKDILADYKEQSHNTLGKFNEKFETKSGKIFYVVTKLYQDENFEQIYVKVKKIEANTYIGTIASNPLGKVKFKYGDPIQVTIDKIEDWVIVTQDGNEEGNLQGKALDLAQAGSAAFISKVSAQDKKYISSSVESVRNPLTKQEIIDIVPESVLKDVDIYVTAKFSNAAAADNKDIYVFTFVKFPSWEIVPEKQ